MKQPRYMVAPIGPAGIRYHQPVLRTNIRERAYEAAKAAGAVIVDRRTGKIGSRREIAPGDYAWFWEATPPEAA